MRPHQHPAPREHFRPNDVYLSTAKEGDNVLGSVCPSICSPVRLSVCLSVCHSSEQRRVIISPRSLSALGSVRVSVSPSVSPSVCLFALSRLNSLIYRFKVFVCVSLIRGRMRITARMRSIGFFLSSRCHTKWRMEGIHVQSCFGMTTSKNTSNLFGWRSSVVKH